MPALLKVSASVRPSRVSIFQSLSWGRDVLSPKVGLTAGLGLDLQMWSPPGEWRGGSPFATADLLQKLHCLLVQWGFASLWEKPEAWSRLTPKKSFRVL